MLLVISPIRAAAAESADPAALLQAARHNDGAAIRTLVAAKANVNSRQGDGATALHWAAYHDNLEVADLLLRAGAAADAVNELGVTPLYLACDNGSAAMVERLLSAGANAGHTLPSGETMLMTAARSGNLNAVKALIAHGADVNAREHTEDQTALMWAASRHAPAVVQALVAAGADVHARSRVRKNVIARSLKTDMPGAIETVEEGGYTALLFAARHGDVESSRYLLDGGADVNAAAPFGTSALVIAAYSGHETLGEFLLERGADPDAAGAGYGALHAAVLRGKTELVKSLLAHHANPNLRMTDGSPVGRQSSTLFVLDGSLKGATPLFLAAKYVEVESMKALVAAGADPTLTLPDGTTPLMVAAGHLSSGLGRGG
jgi:ankyrin repeat protein